MLKKEKIIKKIVSCILAFALCIPVIGFGTEIAEAEEIFPGTKIYTVWQDGVKWAYTNNSDGTITLGYEGFDAATIADNIKFPKPVRVEVPEYLDGKKVTVLGDMFYFDQFVRSVKLPDTITTIKEDAFCGCKRLEEVTVPESVKYIGNDAFLPQYTSEGEKKFPPYIYTTSGSYAEQYAKENGLKYYIINEKAVESINIYCNGESSIKIGDNTKLSAVIQPVNAKNKIVKWSVADKDIVSIDVSSDTLECTITGINGGTTKIIATTEDGGFTDSYDITVLKEIPSLSVKISQNDIKVTPAKKTINTKKSFNIKAVFKEEFIEDMEDEEIDNIWESNIAGITYSSSNKSIASVSKEGKVTAKKKGNAVIKTTIKMVNGKEYIYKTSVNVKRGIF